MLNQTLSNILDKEATTKVNENQLFDDLNNTFFDYPKDKTLVDLFYEQVDKTPNNIALIFGNTEFTYSELNTVSNQFADYLNQTYSIRPDELVGMMLDRSEWMIIAILGILKAGGAYVPVDPDYPQDRINYIKEDCACRVFVDYNELDAFRLSKHKYSTQNKKSDLISSNLVYCIYTSGSTGKPKGVLVEHRNVVNLLWSQKEVYKITPDERVLQFSTITFDPSAEQIFIAFLTGAGLVIINKNTLLDVKSFEKYIIAKKVTHIHAVPTYLAELTIEDMSQVKRVITGGESCLPALAAKWNNHCTFINEYGPTETTITSIEYVFEKSGNPYPFIPIGRPVANTQIHMLGENKELMPFGEIGEIYIGGDGVTRGYLNRPELTKERFIENPHKPGDRIYRTGDVGRWLPDGNIEYLGRIDDQVKIRGYRIELDEISAILEKHPKVTAAVVVARAVSGEDKELIAYVTGPAEIAELNAYLKLQLPSYMVPGYYVSLETLPLTSNGKVDKKNLPLPTERYHEKRTDFKAASSELEKTLVNIWQKILNIEQIGIDDNFFDLGGTSLAAVRAMGQINTATDSSLSSTVLYQQPTIRGLAKKIDSNSALDVNPIILLKEGTGSPLFIFPPWSSYPTIFNEFVNSYNADNPLYGIIYTEDHENFPYKSVQEYVKFIVGHIKKLHPKGPYNLLGYSLGARTVFEAAVQLQQAGEKVNMVAAISHFPSYPSKRLFLSRRILDEIRVFQKIKPSLKFKYLYLRLPHFIKLVMQGKQNLPEIVLEVETQNRIFEIHDSYETNQRYCGELLLIYEPNPDGDESEFKKVQVYRNSIFRQLWSKYIDGNIIEKIVETRHIDFFKQPVVKEVTGIIESYLADKK
ncbi:amino acid adenylation domain-containing protein [Mucilaginibacter sp. BT774]|uniref:non-ribosomal peptide synthetase n=1 Tax=Mucilaginibacter sp. BT774 TaxID=3062276 RepID=UPI002676B06B|nr:amino acid adenylation domain-containing protein [Mucilaginibacter sp. BT774]MDO3624819.1 amino acid adenylation domain-containing protein [Mucilaginibacter sp. BT774]